MTDTAVWIDPARKSGEPCIGGRRLSIELVIDAVWNDGIAKATSTYDLTRAQVLNACWYAGAGYPIRLHDEQGDYAPHQGSWRRRWGNWVDRVRKPLSDCDYDRVPDPPTEADMSYLVDYAEAGRMVGVDTRTVRQWKSRHRLSPVATDGTRLLFRPEDVLRANAETMNVPQGRKRGEQWR